LTSQCPFSRTPPQGPLRIVFGQFIGHDMPVLESTQFPHILQSKNSALPVASSAVIGTVQPCADGARDNPLEQYRRSPD
jgi:hypothetical protein